MGKIIQSGIRRVYYKHKHDDSKITDEMVREAGVTMTDMITKEPCYILRSFDV
jgi:deoxycytidylate deaminase